MIPPTLRAMVFSNKKKLKGNKDKIFICENLTKHRYDMLKRLNTQIGTCDKLQVKHSVQIVISNIKQQSSFQFNLGNQEQVCRYLNTLYFVLVI
jgi:hypothetical protein